MVGSGIASGLDGAMYNCDVDKSKDLVDPSTSEFASEATGGATTKVEGGLPGCGDDETGFGNIVPGRDTF